MESKRGIFICDKIPNLPQASLLWLYAMTGINKDYCSRGLRQEAMRGKVAKGAVKGRGAAKRFDRERCKRYH
ncbi:hypothetical protein LOK49_LG07G01859 [Camellia lanceoleosa]|uniref:Uncharacterized protein n=1 Tax=Camellia lanceoleosa TaxID=1840588 RepID=A0ACC0H2X4_9ERIC|nr:hypothetical protein LOK49_LG07G01859 [Camellia lanceoleosa]